MHEVNGQAACLSHEGSVQRQGGARQLKNNRQDNVSEKGMTENALSVREEKSIY